MPSTPAGAIVFNHAYCGEEVPKNGFGAQVVLRRRHRLARDPAAQTLAYEAPPATATRGRVPAGVFPTSSS